MPTLNFSASSIHASAIEAVSAAIGRSEVDRALLNEHCRSIFGGTNADGAWTQRDSFELLEQGLIHHALQLAPVTAIHQIPVLSDLIRSLPTHTVRSEEQIRFQQFSTPLDLAAVAMLLAQPSPSDLVLEPSAGHGCLVSMLPPVAALHLNELDERRVAALQILFPSATVTRHDGALLTSIGATDYRPSLILMNPPFSRSANRGADHYAAVRHLRAAIAKAQPGARIVAIMPDWFTPAGKMDAIYAQTFRGCTVQTSARLERCYEKQGTSVAVRLYVIDKCKGNTRPAQLLCSTVTELLAKVEIVPRQALSGGRDTSPALKPSLFKALKVKRPSIAPMIPAPLTRQILTLTYDTLAAPRPLGEQVGVYIPYRPSRIDLAGAAPHPSALVESVAMGSIPAPIPAYSPTLHDHIVSDGILSEAQIETLIYAGHAWGQDLAGRFKPSTENVSLKSDEEGFEYRQGYFLGDGTGAGKGRQIAGCILDHWLKGHRRHIWVSKNEALLEDARRDWQALGGLSSDIQPLSNWKIDEDIRLSSGILFVTYPTLRSQRQDATRLHQVLSWAGPDYDGIIAFDESHEMGGVAGGEGALGKTKGSAQGIAGVLLQNHLPRARVLYASATGASDVNNFAYAVRLGLWGPQTSFPTRENFITDIRAGGIAAMELVTRDLKALGLYQARALSFAGVEYDILKHELQSDQIAIYDAYSQAWAVIHRNVEQAMILTATVDDISGETLNSGAKAAARSRLESCKQRFFNQVLLSMKLPTIIQATNEHIAAGQAVVIQIVTTAESILDRRLGNLSPEARAHLEIDLSPREYVIDYLERAFPTQQMQVFTDDTGQARSQPMFDDDGHPVHNSEAIEARQNLIEHLCAMPPIKSALDALIEHYGTDRIAEVTGRTKRLITMSDGTQKLESRSARTNQSETAQFMNGDKDILIFSDAGGTGRSYHASLDARNQKQRVHLLLEPGWRADRAIQGLGRTHRTHQAQTPIFRPCTTNCKGELRFTSTIARRLDSLGALTRGQRQTGGQNLFDPADNLESEYAKAALITWYQLLQIGKLKSTSMAEFEHLSGLELIGEDGILVEDLPPITRWLNRVLALPIAMQDGIFDEFLSLVETRVSAAREAGTLDVGVETILADKATVRNEVILRTDQRSGATSRLLTIETETAIRPMSLERILAVADALESPQFLINHRSSRVALCGRARSFMEDNGELLERVVLTRPTKRQYRYVSDLAESAWEPTDRATFAALWAKEADDAAQQVRVETVHLATGLLLPIWSALASEQIAVNRIVDKNGNSWLGRIVHESRVPQLLRTFGVASEFRVTAKGILEAIAATGSAHIDHPTPLTVKKSLVNREQRIELVGNWFHDMAWLKSIGCFTEIIQYKTRLFVPASSAGDILERIIERK